MYFECFEIHYQYNSQTMIQHRHHESPVTNVIQRYKRYTALQTLQTLHSVTNVTNVTQRYKRYKRRNLICCRWTGLCGRQSGRGTSWRVAEETLAIRWRSSGSLSDAQIRLTHAGCVTNVTNVVTFVTLCNVCNVCDVCNAGKTFVTRF